TDFHQYDQALQVVQAMSPYFAQASWLVVLASRLAKSGELKRAQGLASEAYRLARALESIPSRFQVLGDLAVFHALIGQAKRSADRFVQALRAAQNLPGPTDIVVEFIGLV